MLHQHSGFSPSVAVSFWSVTRLLVYYQVMAEGLPQLLRCVLAVLGVMLVPDWGLAVFCGAQVSWLAVGRFLECRTQCPMAWSSESKFLVIMYKQETGGKFF